MFKHTMLNALAGVLAIAGTTALAANSQPVPLPVYAIDTHFAGAGGDATGGDYRLRSSVGQWEVDMVKLSSSNGLQLEGGMWPNLTLPDCAEDLDHTDANCR